MAASLVGGQGVAVAAGPGGPKPPKPPPPSSDPWRRANDIRAQVRRPHFPPRTFDVKKYGAVGDGTTMNTEAFRKAIEACHAAGGGKVVVPKGEFLTGPIHLLSNVNLHVTGDARILFSQNPSDYLPAVLTRFEGTECYNYSPLIYALGQQNIAVTGTGVLDGQADNDHWWPWKGSGPTAGSPASHTRPRRTPG